MTLVWKITHDEEAWKHGLNLILSWREQTAHDWRNPVYILAHGLMLSERAQTSSEASDINHAIAILEQAVESVRWDLFVAWKGSLPLASLLLIRYKQIEDVADLEAAGRYAWQKVSTGSATDPDRYYALNTFVQVLLEHYELKSEINDLEAAIVQATAAIKVAPGTYERGDMEMLLGSALRCLYQRSKSGEILKQAIKAHELALEHTNRKDPELVALRTGNLANAIADRYAQSKTRVDIDRAIELTQAALDQLPKQSPQKTRILRNLGLNLIELGRAQIDDHVLQSALTLLRDGLSLSRENKDEDEEILLLTIIANNLLNLDLLQGVHSRLDEAISTLEQAYEKSWVSNKIATEVTYRLAERDKTIQIVRLLTGALLRRAQLGGAQTNQDLTRAFVLGEASKSALLISEIMRRSLNAPSSIPQNMIEREGQLLARLAGLDNIHLRAYSTSLVRRRRQMEERADLISALEDVWNEVEATGHEGRTYVNLRRLPHEAIIQLLSKARGATACVSLLETTFPNSAGQNQRRLAIMALWPILIRSTTIVLVT